MKEEVVKVDLPVGRGNARGQLCEVRQVLREQLDVDKPVGGLVGASPDELRRRGDGHRRAIGQAPELSVSLQHIFTRHLVDELVVAPTGGLELEAIVDKERGGKPWLCVAAAGLVVAREANAGDHEQSGPDQPCDLEPALKCVPDTYGDGDGRSERQIFNTIVLGRRGATETELGAAGAGIVEVRVADRHLTLDPVVPGA